VDKYYSRSFHGFNNNDVINQHIERLIQ